MSNYNKKYKLKGGIYTETNTLTNKLDNIKQQEQTENKIIDNTIVKSDEVNSEVKSNEVNSEVNSEIKPSEVNSEVNSEIKPNEVNSEVKPNEVNSEIKPNEVNSNEVKQIFNTTVESNTEQTVKQAIVPDLKPDDINSLIIINNNLRSHIKLSLLIFRKLINFDHKYIHQIFNEYNKKNTE
jgi:hypothetical protein